jgi:hypothetical protein
MRRDRPTVWDNNTTVTVDVDRRLARPPKKSAAPKVAADIKARRALTVRRL